MNAIAVFNDKIKGFVRFHQCLEHPQTLVEFDLGGFKPHKTHGIHIHKYGILSVENACDSTCEHYNPHDTLHGSIELYGTSRHVGDLINNLISDGKGNFKYSYIDNLIKTNFIKMPMASLLDGQHRLTKTILRETKFTYDAAAPHGAAESFRQLPLSSPGEGTVLSDEHGRRYIRQEYDEQRDRLRGLSTSITLRSSFVVHPQPDTQQAARYHPSPHPKSGYRVFVCWLLPQGTPIPEELTIDQDGPNHCTIAPADERDVEVTVLNDDEFEVPLINQLPWQFGQLVYLKAGSEHFDLPSWFRDRFGEVVKSFDEIFERGGVDDVCEIADICAILSGVSTETETNDTLWARLRLAITKYMEYNANGTCDAAPAAYELIAKKSTKVIKK